ncbi:hypothetical protein CWI38_1074p0030 [Hamiltosporidium tvaerminnensis]|uniref:Integrase zinc-binding domain-containing protein n=1 Tax=Hamiltosporidium tvaerminnensis TaxID=1176355 RepID=A0A4Q9LU39_9MICR|nr:hypothetical protein CWI38_1074p0030 [Hamiltosporidium tvaerminnensis]
MAVGYKFTKVLQNTKVFFENNQNRHAGLKKQNEKEILTTYLKTGQYPAEYSKEEKGLLRQRAEHFTMLGDYICFKRRDHLIRAVFGFKTVLIKQIIQTEHALAHIRVNKMMALFVEKYYGIPKAYIKEYVKDCEACTRFNCLKTIQPIYINHITKIHALFIMECVDCMRFSA